MFSFESGSLCNLTQKKKNQTKQNKRKEIWKRERERAPQVLPRRATVAITYSGQQPKNPRPDPATIITVKAKKLYKWVQVISLSLCIALWLLSKMKVKEKEKNMKYSTLQSTPLFLNSQIKEKEI